MVYKKCTIQCVFDNCKGLHLKIDCETYNIIHNYVVFKSEEHLVSSQIHMLMYRHSLRPA